MRVRARHAGHLATLCSAVLGAGLVVAALHGGSPTTTRLAAAAYRPPVTVAAPPPAAEVHTTSGNAAAVRPVKPARRVVPARPAPARVAKPAARRTTATVRQPAPTFQQALDAAIARIPTYRPGTARWVVSRAYAFWGTADWYHDVLYVSPDVPLSKLYDVAVHEWSHELSVLDYGGDVAAATAAMNAWFGGSDLTGPERAADCMAVLQGAHWTHYTTCTNAVWRAGAAKLMAGQRL